MRALLEGRYDEAEAVADKLDGRDSNVVAIKAQAAIARGRYAPAEALLRPVVARAPSSEAALQLGLLQRMLGRPDAGAILLRVAALAETSDDPLELARAARALRALGRFQEANAAYRDASSGAPNDPGINDRPAARVMTPVEAPMLQPSMGLDPDRFSLLKKPLR